MTKFFSNYTNTVRRMLKNYNVDLFNLFCEQNFEEIWVDHDNWNGGIDYYNLIFKVPVEFFEDLRQRGRVEEIEKKISGFYNDAMRGGDESVQLREVVLRPSADDISLFGENIDDSMWKTGFFRLFISHHSANKISASNLKSCIGYYGIDCFVAHEDISPSKEWEIEIEKALFTMDALCAIVVPDFIKSQWCDQEVGIALGQKKMVISVSKGSDPYGFFGKYQALKSKDKNANEVAEAIWRIISTNDKTKTEYLNKLSVLILNATNKTDALQYIDVIMQCESVGKHIIENLHNNYNSNDILNSTEVIDHINPLFKKYGLVPLTMMPQTAINNNDIDLPF